MRFLELSGAGCTLHGASCVLIINAITHVRACTLRRLSGKEVSNVAWALAEVGLYEPDLWDSMAAHLLTPKSARGQPQPIPEALSRGSSSSKGSAKGRKGGKRRGQAGAEDQEGEEERGYSSEEDEGDDAWVPQGTRKGKGNAEGSGPGPTPLDQMQLFEMAKLVAAYAKVRLHGMLACACWHGALACVCLLACACLDIPDVFCFHPGAPLATMVDAQEPRVHVLRLCWLLQVGHVDEELFGAVSERMCAAARAIQPAHNLSQPPPPLQQQQPQQQPLQGSSASSSSSSSMATSEGAAEDGRGQGGATSGGKARGSSRRGTQAGLSRSWRALHAGTVSRTMWAFAMQGLHDDPVLPELVPHAKVGVGSAL